MSTPPKHSRPAKDAFEHGLPASVDAERSVLGAILLDNGCFDETEKLTVFDFALDSHRRIFSCMASIFADGRPVDIVTLSNELIDRKEVEAVGGIAYLASLTEGLPRRVSIAEDVRIVEEKSRLRKIVTTCASVMTKAGDPCIDSAELLETIGTSMLQIAADSAEEQETARAALRAASTYSKFAPEGTSRAR